MNPSKSDFSGSCHNPEYARYAHSSSIIRFELVLMFCVYHFSQSECASIKQVGKLSHRLLVIYSNNSILNVINNSNSPTSPAFFVDVFMSLTVHCFTINCYRNSFSNLIPSMLVCLANFLFLPK